MHHSILDWQGQTYLFLSTRICRPGLTRTARSGADKLFFNPDGGIQEVKPTLRGGKLGQGQRDSNRPAGAKSPEGVAITFLDDTNPHAGWKTTFGNATSWVRFNEGGLCRARRSPSRCAPSQAPAALLEFAWTAPAGPCWAPWWVARRLTGLSSAVAKKHAGRACMTSWVTQNRCQGRRGGFG